MNWPLNESMQKTQEQAGKKPFKTLLFTVVMFIVNLLISMLFAIFLLGPIIYSKVSESNYSPEQVSEMIINHPFVSYINLYVTILTIIVTILLAKWFQGRKLNSFGFYKEALFKKYSLGILIATGLMVVIYLANLMMGSIVTQLNPQASWIAFIILLIGFMIQGMSEEILLRGYVMNGLATAWGVPAAILLNSIIFSFMHYSNPGITNLALVNIALAGIFFSLLFYITDNMWLTGAAHSFWNFMMGVVFGVQVSGLNLPGTLFITQAKPNATLINGGDFGFEGGIVVTIILIIASIYLVYLVSKRPKNLTTV
ncbi:CPBP family intramembrane glutamic endopeptidase [Facklamia miroungae]|uniref:CAAX prenyl protease 2/Lysostaphin resistance protein A-like domain-containing protein n=1 Tax=Facklamia miroungae TaxID=120956 RepID=A0A1G7SZH5_9LACT|nr:CPBP family intramembrane glutamic endopeptidase [Facklamia miroungae]NKZ29471.1 CPBP family intramembrane metalloprotease [Facklamia miroungae]SDG28506.1 hypothetical protein SAMN05421791_104226 [Facklamia miroungae]